MRHYRQKQIKKMHQEFIAKAQELAHSAAKNRTEEEINSLITSLYAGHRLAEKDKEALEEFKQKAKNF